MSKKDEKPFTKAEAPLQQFSSHSLAAPRFGRLARPATLQSQKASPLNSKSTILTPDSPLREVPWICLSSGLHRMQQERKSSVIEITAALFVFSHGLFFGLELLELGALCGRPRHPWAFCSLWPGRQRLTSKRPCFPGKFNSQTSEAHFLDDLGRASHPDGELFFY